MNTAAFGMTVQKLICDKYNLMPNEWAENQFNSNYDKKYDEVSKIFPKIFEEIGSYPIKCLTFEKNVVPGNTLSPHNFYLSNGMTMSIKTTRTKMNSKVAPQVVGQAGYEKLNYHFGHLVDEKISDQNDIKNLIWNNIESVIPIFIDYLFLSDILLWIYIENDNYEYKIIYRDEKPDFKWEKSKFSFTRSNVFEWKESLTIKYDNLSIAEVQIHKNRNFKFRFILDKLEKMFTVREKNNETLGISIENAICNLFDLDKPPHLDKRSDPRIMETAKDAILKAFEKMPEPIRYVGAEKGERGGASKSPVDFILEDEKTLSLKTNIGSKVCPPEIGQPSIETFKKHFAYLIADLDTFSTDDFKQIAIECTEDLMNNYLKYLLDCDYLLWIYQKSSIYNYKILSRDMKFTFKQENFTFTRNLNEWNESNTVKYCGITIGEFQIHKNRNSLKFRFDMKNLINLLEDNVRE
jgi:hypothetical protein